jgi:hypothetical protein
VLDLNNVGLPEHIFICLNSIYIFKLKTCFGGILLDSYSANDEKQAQIILFYPYCTFTIHFSSYSPDEELERDATY